MTNLNLREAIAPKSDQLNSDDLLGTQRTVQVTSVTAGNKEQPVVIGYQGDGGRPYKPCKSMLRVLVQAWGDDGREWVGRSMKLYCDPEVKFGGVKVGGIRISALSHIDAPMEIMLTVTRAKRQAYRVEVLKEAPPEAKNYPAEMFAENLPKWAELVKSGTMTPQQIANKAAERAPLTAEQHEQVMALSAGPEVTTSDDEGF